jgi:hypothetical protein
VPEPAPDAHLAASPASRRLLAAALLVLAVVGSAPLASGGPHSEAPTPTSEITVAGR